jgi:hypothetical protein
MGDARGNRGRMDSGSELLTVMDQEERDRIMTEAYALLAERDAEEAVRAARNRLELPEPEDPVATWRREAQGA